MAQGSTKGIDSEKMIGTMVFIGLGVIVFFTAYRISKMIKEVKQSEGKSI